jgi:glycosyltransferase involved in cell wall biosynthesis
MQLAGAKTELSVFACGRGAKEPNVHAVMPRQLLRFVGSTSKPFNSFLLHRYFESRVQPNTTAYFWLSSPPALVERVKSRGGFALREMINCTAKLRREELDRAYDLLGWQNPTPVSDDEIRGERDELLACDAVYCPNPQVRASVRAYGVPDDRCIDCSYGWSESRLTAHAHAPQPHDGINVLFVGTLDVRKGIPWLLKAWKNAKVKGTLLLAGALDPLIAQQGATWLDQPNVKLLGHVKDIAAVYDRADLFVFPTWEEGGPMVTLEAMAHGLPCVVTPMGTSGAVTEREGIVVTPGSVEELTSALVRLAADAELRRSLGNAAYERSQQYTWTNVGARRLAGLRSLLSLAA